MLIDTYNYPDEDGVKVSAKQGCRFAKEVAGDFNPIHDAEARRFCVPGDLLVAMVLRRQGLVPQMRVRFRGMVGADVPLVFQDDSSEQVRMTDAQGRTFVEVEQAGTPIKDPERIDAFTRQYSAFSGRTFPELLEPLLREHGVMFNPDRPLVFYDSVNLTLDATPGTSPELSLADSELEVAGRRADAHLTFTITNGGRTIGRGTKTAVVSGLQAWDEARMQDVLARYRARCEQHATG
ncbi:MAG: DUF3581 family protein [Ectothiorhodospiraceae bacterium]